MLTTIQINTFSRKSSILAYAFFIFVIFNMAGRASAQSDSLAVRPLRLAIVGLVHDHILGILRAPKNPNVQIVGFSESDSSVVARYIRDYHLDPKIIFSSPEELIAKTRPEAVAVFTSISEHIKIVRLCAPKHIHVMVEKPLALNISEAREMKSLADRWGIYIITNYETSWYPVTKDSYEKINTENQIGAIEKMVIHDGHPGPVEIGCSKDFLRWLTDPALNGGGAIMDFGCYGANLATYLLKGARPISVTAVTQQIKPNLYPKVDDEATIILTYPKTQVIIQASWNWPFSRKDMEIYGKAGYIITQDNIHMRIKKVDHTPEQLLTLEPDQAIAPNGLSFFESVIRGKYLMKPGDPSCLSINLIAMEILDAAVRSAREGKSINLY
jgi:predicted dehydrogenase